MGSNCYEKTVIGADEFRRLLGHFATGVTIVTTGRGSRDPSGLTVSAFTSLSLDPPLVLVCIAHRAQSYAALLENGRFAVNILRSEQEPLSQRFASTRQDKFDGVAHHAGPLGQPILDGSLASMECDVVTTLVAGDHTIFVGRVGHAEVHGGDPLVYHGGQYRRLQGGSS